jgi:hypothetical protein
MKEECAMISRALIGCAIASLWFLTLPGWGAEYRLQVTDIDWLTFSSHAGAGRQDATAV